MRKNLDQDDEKCGTLIETRITRSNVSLQDSKRLPKNSILVKKALLLKSKSLKGKKHFENYSSGVIFNLIVK